MNDQQTPDDDLRRLIHGAADGIRPQGTLDDILDRTKKVDPMARRWFLPVIAAAAVVAFVIGGAVWVAQDSNDPKGHPGPLGNNTPTPTEGAPVQMQTVAEYFAGEAAQGTRLYREFQKVEACSAETPDCTLEAAVAQSIGGGPLDPDYRSLWPETRLLGASFADDLITIDLPTTTHDRPTGMSAEDADLAIQQVIFTAQAAIGKGRLPVRFTIDGGPTDTVLGVPTSEPLAAANELDVLAPVQISNPSEGATLKAGAIKVEGVAAAFEANVLWEVKDGAGDVVKNSFATAQECCKLAPYTFTVDLEPGRYTIVVHDTDESGEGLPTNSDTKEIVVE